MSSLEIPRLLQPSSVTPSQAPETETRDQSVVAAAILLPALSPPTLSRPDQIFVPSLAVQVNLKYRAQQIHARGFQYPIDDFRTIRDLGRSGDLIHFVGR
jgi:hypothetical protein